MQQKANEASLYFYTHQTPINIMDGGSGTPEVSTMDVGSGTPMACRWNPTKEQINMLEILYLQGLRTPTVEQIQEITTKLQTYGHIEGKNVFYWFQNHKARQRQKEKTDHVTLFQQYQHHLQRPQPLIHLPSSSNIVYEHPCYMPHNNVGFYVHHLPQALSPSTSNSTINIRSPQMAPMPVMEEIAGFVLKHHPENVARGNNMINHEQNEIFNGKSCDHKKTLDLFPLHPTGILQERVDTTGNASCIAPSAWTSNSSGGVVDRRYFEFFC